MKALIKPVTDAVILHRDNVILGKPSSGLYGRLSELLLTHTSLNVKVVEGHHNNLTPNTLMNMDDISNLMKTPLANIKKQYGGAKTSSVKNGKVYGALKKEEWTLTINTSSIVKQGSPHVAKNICSAVENSLKKLSAANKIIKLAGKPQELEDPTAFASQLVNSGDLGYTVLSKTLAAITAVLTTVLIPFIIEKFTPVGQFITIVLLITLIYKFYTFKDSKGRDVQREKEIEARAERDAKQREKDEWVRRREREKKRLKET